MPPEEPSSPELRRGQSVHPVAKGPPWLRRPRRTAPAVKSPAPAVSPAAPVIVGVGGAAGGLEAFAALMGAMPENPGMAFVLVQHPQPGADDLLDALHAGVPRCPVDEITDGLTPEPGHVYLLPPNANVSLERGQLRLRPLTFHKGQPMPVDIFFRSLAAENRGRAVGVILSGDCTDGALGVEALKGEGGITLVQEERTAAHPEMPSAAVDTGCVDFVLPPGDLARELVRLNAHACVQTEASLGLVEPGLVSKVSPDGSVAPTDSLTHAGHSDHANAADTAAALGVSTRRRQADFQAILTQLRNAVGVDFSQYKPGTIERRIERRIALLHLDGLRAYSRFLQDNETELLTLYHDILIKVTCFFRDPEAFDVLKRRVFPRMLKNRTGDEPVRFWVPGCATGEEAYSLAIALAEFLGRRRASVPVQIFATDLSEPALDRAREGVYIENIALDVSTERLKRFFTRQGRNYVVNKPVREMIVFARQNLVKDPPFSRLDLVSCRNLLIYLAPALQRRVFPTFHYALRPGGHLLLGASESVGEFSDLFSPVDKQARLFARKSNVARARFDVTSGQPTAALPTRPDFHSQAAPANPHPPLPPRAEKAAAPPAPAAFAEDGAADVQREADRLLLTRFTPAGVLVNADLEIIQFRGQGHHYFEPAPGRASFHLMKMVKEGFAVPLRTIVTQAQRDGAPARRRVSYEEAGQTREVELEVIPLHGGPGKERHLLVLFHPPAAPVDAAAAPEPARARPNAESRAAEGRVVHRLRADLADLRHHLQSVLEEQDASTEEIKSANEEILSANEELQSTNEELETAKEELQSSNEELATVNDELQTRNRELSRANGDLTNILNSISFAIVMLGADGRVRSFTNTAAKVFNLIPTDIGRPFSDIQPRLQLPDLSAQIEEVIRTIEPRDLEVRDREGRWYALSIRPYRTPDHRIDGAVLGLVDIDALTRRVGEAHAARDFAEAVVATVREPLLVLDGDLRVVSANAAFHTVFKTDPAKTLGRPLQALSERQWNLPGLTQRLATVADEGKSLENFSVEHTFPGLGRRHMVLNARPIAGAGDRPQLILLAIEDATGHQQAGQQILAIAEREQRRMAHDLHDGLGQNLAGIGLMTKALINGLHARGAPGETIREVEALLTQVSQATALTRDLARGLHPAQLAAGQLKTAMETLAANVESLFKVACTFRCENGLCETVADDTEVSTHLYRIAQEAVHNALRHGKPTRIAIVCHLDASMGRGAMTVSDDGTGIRQPRGHAAASIVNKTGMGLQIMRYRAEALHGQLTVSRGPAGGTTVSVAFPV